MKFFISMCDFRKRTCNSHGRSLQSNSKSESRSWKGRDWSSGKEWNRIADKLFQCQLHCSFVHKLAQSAFGEKCTVIGAKVFRADIFYRRLMHSWAESRLRLPALIRNITRFQRSSTTWNDVNYKLTQQKTTKKTGCDSCNYTFKLVKTRGKWSTELLGGRGGWGWDGTTLHCQATRY